MPRQPTRRAHGEDPTAALFVRIPAEQARRLDRAAFELQVPKQRLVSGLLERYVDPDSPSSLAALGAPGLKERQTEGRRITVQAIDPQGLTVGHHSFHPREPDVLDRQEAAELLRVEPELIQSMALNGELPGRQLGGLWRFSRQALLRWLAGGASPTPAEWADAHEQKPPAGSVTGPESPER
jgi:excisionase family DNA binding protein